MSVYGATKSGIRALCESMAIELAPHGIRVNHIGPGWVLSQLNDPSPALETEEITRANLATIPIEGRAADPYELGPRGRVPRIVGRRLRDRRLPARRRRLRRGEVLMAHDHRHRRARRDRPGDPARRSRSARRSTRPSPARRARRRSRSSRSPRPTGTPASRDPRRRSWRPRPAINRGDAPHRPRLVGRRPCAPSTARRSPPPRARSCTRSARSPRPSSGPTGTTVNVVAPGFVGDARFDAGVPLGRPPAPAGRRRDVSPSWPPRRPAT